MTLPPRPEVLFLDAGNTVVFLDHDAVSGILAAHGDPVDAATLRSAEGRAKRHYEELLEGGGSHEDGWYLLVSRMLAEAGVPPDRCDALTQRLREAHDRHNLWRRVPADLPGALDRAREAGIRLAVISNSEGRLPELFDRVGLGGYFEAVVDSSVEGVSKPDPRIFERAIERMGTTAERSCYAGDIPRVDVAGARRAGMYAVLVDPFGFFPDHAEAHRVESVSELIDAWLDR